MMALKMYFYPIKHCLTFLCEEADYSWGNRPTTNLVMGEILLTDFSWLCSLSQFNLLLFC